MVPAATMNNAYKSRQLISQSAACRLPVTKVSLNGYPTFLLQLNNLQSKSNNFFRNRRESEPSPRPT